jgi:hypothetical protein
VAGNTPSDRPNHGLWIVHDPGICDPLETWERHLADLESIPPETRPDNAIQRAKQTIAIKKAVAKEMAEKKAARD